MIRRIPRWMQITMDPKTEEEKYWTTEIRAAKEIKDTLAFDECRENLKRLAKIRHEGKGERG